MEGTPEAGNAYRLLNPRSPHRRGCLFPGAPVQDRWLSGDGELGELGEDGKLGKEYRSRCLATFEFCCSPRRDRAGRCLSALGPHGTGKQGRDEAEHGHQRQSHSQSRLIGDKPDQRAPRRADRRIRRSPPRRSPSPTPGRACGPRLRAQSERRPPVPLRHRRIRSPRPGSCRSTTRRSSPDPPPDLPRGPAARRPKRTVSASPAKRIPAIASDDAA